MFIAHGVMGGGFGACLMMDQNRAEGRHAWAGGRLLDKPRCNRVGHQLFPLLASDSSPLFFPQSAVKLGQPPRPLSSILTSTNPSRRLRQTFAPRHHSNNLHYARPQHHLRPGRSRHRHPRCPVSPIPPSHVLTPPQPAPG